MTLGLVSVELYTPNPGELRSKLLEERATPGTLVVSAVHGLGGIGKSTLAAALARDSEVLARFPEGWGQVRFMRDRLLGRQARLVEYK